MFQNVTAFKGTSIVRMLLLATVPLLAAVPACSTNTPQLADGRLDQMVDANTHVLPDAAQGGIDAPTSAIDATGQSHPDAAIVTAIDAQLAADANSPTPDALITQPDADLPSFAGGDGSSGNPFQIATAVQFVNANNPAYKASSFQLIADVDLAGTTVSPIANFDGTFDGNGHSISNWSFTATSGGCNGMFGTLTGIVHDLTVISPLVVNGDYVGGIVGCNSGKLFRDQVIGGQVQSASGQGGGIAGQQSGYTNYYIAGASPIVGIVACSSSATVSGSAQGGGLVGMNLYGQIIDSYATGEVDETNAAGGLYNFSYGSEVRRTYASGKIDVSNNSAGLAVSNEGSPTTVTDSFWDLDTTGQPSSQSGTGLTDAQMTDSTNFTGWDFLDVWQLVDGALPTLRADADIAPLTPCETDINMTGGGAPFSINLPAFDLTGAPLTYEIVDQPHFGTMSAINGSVVTYTPNDASVTSDSFSYQAIDDLGVTSAVSPMYIRAPTINYTCSAGISDFVHGGDGSVGNPYVIATDLELFAVHTYLTCNYILEADLDIQNGFVYPQGRAFPPIGGPNGFQGTFDGNGHTLSDWTYGGTGANESVGLFSFINGGTVKNLKISSFNLSGTADAGALAGESSSATITNVTTSGVINGVGSDFSGVSRVGGLIGRANGGAITSCASDATVTGTDAAVGGLVGFKPAGAVSNSSASGAASVHGGNVGGLFGFLLKRATVTNCFATGSVTLEESGIAGGFAGQVNFDGGQIQDSYSTGSVNAQNVDPSTQVGGFIGLVQSDASNSLQRIFAIGKVSSNAIVGGLVGAVADGDIVQPITDGFWDTDTTTLSTSADGGSPQSDADMHLQSTYTDFDFTNTWAIQPGGYPTLR